MNNRIIDSACAVMARTITQELAEMARFQPIRFHDFEAAMSHLTRLEEEVDLLSEEQYAYYMVACKIEQLLATIPPNRLQPRAIRQIA